MTFSDVRIGAVYHWSPSSNREAILRDGLKPYSPPVVHGAGSFPYVCTGPTPAAAWSLSGDMEWTSEIEEWDLWQVRLADGDEISVRAEFGPQILEVRVRNAIPADRVWWVGQRCPLFAKE